MSLAGKSSIFEGISNQFAIDPASIRLISDRVLLKDLGDAEKEGSIIIPPAFRERGLNEFNTYRMGLVIAVGPGDRFRELGVTDENEVRRMLLTEPCGWCAGEGKHFDIRSYSIVNCRLCNGTGREGVCVPPQCVPGDKVLYEKRLECEVYLNGERYVLCHAEQAVIAILEDE